MKPRRPPVSAVTALVAVVLILVPALAWLQYRWVGQVSDAERERMQRTLRTSALQFATAFDTEVARAVGGLQLEGSVMRDENWTSYAQRYTAWTERASDVRLVREVLLVDALPGSATPPVEPDELRLRRWNNDIPAFEAAPWTDELSAMRPVLAEHFGQVRLMRSQGGGRFRRESAVSFSVDDDYTLVSPVTLFDFPDGRTSAPRFDVLGFTLIRIDPDYVRTTLLPMLAARHFHGEDGANDYRIAVTDRREPAHVIWESEPGVAAAIGRAPDVDQAFMSARPDQVFMIARNGERATTTTPATAGPGERVVISVLQERRVADAGPPPPPPAPGGAFGPFEGRWHVMATHRAGSLEAAVAAVRTRNLMLSSGILALLSMAIGLIVISARRAQTLARQQLEFVAAVSHELRTPVSVIGTAAGNLADGVVADPARVRKYGETIQGEARRLGETVERVLQLAGIAAGSSAAAWGPVAVPDLVRQALSGCRPEIDSRGVTVEVSLADDLPPVYGDAAALGSAVQNLISNAVKYGGDARWVRVTAAASPGLKPRRSVSADGSGSAPGTGSAGYGTADASGAGAARRSTGAVRSAGAERRSAGADRRSAGAVRSAGASAPATHVAIAVSDRGLGIGPEDRKHIFEPFYRGREAVSRQIQGSGLGLNLVWRIVEAHDGRVDVTSEPGKGSTFTLVLPAAPAVPADARGLDSHAFSPPPAR